MGAVMSGVQGIAGIASGLIGAGKRKREQRAAQAEFDKRKNEFEGLDTSNLYSNLENVYEDLTVNQQQAEFTNRAQQQSMANTMDTMQGAAGGSGIAALAQAMANQGSQNAERAGISIGQQERSNQAAQMQQEVELSQFNSVQEYIHGIDSSKQVHIGETGWSSVASDLYGYGGTEAADEYKLGLYYEMITDVCVAKSISCFYFSAFDEPWKDSSNEFGSENHFGLFTVEGKAKYALWNGVDNGTFSGLGRNGKPVEKTYGGNEENLLNRVKAPSAQNME